MSILMSAFLGLVQGLAEFLPISSSGHLSIIQNLFGLNYAEEEHLFFDVLLHLGTLFAVVIFYWTDLRDMVKDTFDVLLGRKSETDEGGRLSPAVRNLVFVIVGTLPLVVILPFYDYFEKLYYNTPFISFALIITGILLFVSGKLSEGRKSEKTSRLSDAVAVGIAQAIAVLPGLSRSGTTITVGLARGFKREYAVRFSFLLSIPAVLGSVLVTVLDAFKTGINWSLFPTYLVGMVVAGVSGYFSMKLLKRIVISNKFDKFAYYCWGAGIVSLILSFVL